MSGPNNVSYESLEYRTMKKRWQLTLDLLGGSFTMQRRGKTWLPKFRLEAESDYDARLARTVLYPALEDAISTLVDKAFSQEVEVKNEEKMPERLLPILDDMDGKGASISEFTQAMLKKAWTFGGFHVMPRFPRTNATANAATEAAESPQPYFTLVSPIDVIGWKSEEDDNGVRELTEVRIRELSVETDENSYVEKRVVRIRVLHETDWELWEGPGSWQKVDGGPHTFGEVPLRTFYERRATNDDNSDSTTLSATSLPVNGFSGFMTMLPPFEELAYANLSHWQKMSDHNNIITVASLPILAMAGATDEQNEKGIKLSAQGVVGLPSTDSKLFFVEHTGKAIEAGVNSIKDLEVRMQKLAFEPLNNTVRVTATREIRDEHKGENRAQSSVRALNRFLRQMFEDAAKWVGIELPDDVQFHIFDDFGIDARGIEEIAQLTLDYQAGVIDHQTCLEEKKRRAFLRDTVDVQDVMDRVKNNPPLGMIAATDMPLGKPGADPNATKDPNAPPKKNPQAA